MTEDTYKIPKKIHYCWFGHAPLTPEVKKTLENWKKVCPDYEIIQWNESNFDVHKNKYMEEAYINKKWAFVTDFARLDIVYNEGGIYLDTDVELIKKLDDLLKYDAYIGFEDIDHVDTGAGFGAVKNHPGIKEIRSAYDNLRFVDSKGQFNILPAPKYVTEKLVEKGLKCGNKEQDVIGIHVLPSEYLCPKSYITGDLNITEKTYSIHHFFGGWVKPIVKKWHYREQKIAKIVGSKPAYFIIRVISLPDRVFNKIREKLTKKK